MSGGEEWSHVAKRGNRGGRAARRAGGGSAQTTAAWIDANLSAAFSRKLATLVAKGQAAKSVVEILKAARVAGEVLSSPQRAALEGQLRRAGHWEAGAGPAVTSEKAAARPARVVALSKDKPHKRETYAAAAGAAKDPTLRELERLLAAERKKTQRLERENKRGCAASAATGGTAAAADDEEMSDLRAAQWMCEYCGRAHPKPKQSCHICRTPRVATAQAGLAPPPTTEQTEAELARLSQQLASFKLMGSDAHVVDAIAAAQARMEQLKTQPPVVAVKTALQTYEQALKAREEIQSRLSALLKKSGTLEVRMDEARMDYEATANALGMVSEELAAASLLSAAALAAMGTPMADVSVTAVTAPSAVAAAAEAITEYKTRVCGLLAATNESSFGEAFARYKAACVAGETSLVEWDFLLQTMTMHVMKQADMQMAVLSQTHHGAPASPASTEAVAIPVPDGADRAAMSTGGTQQGSGDGRLEPRPSTKVTSLEATRAKVDGIRAAELQRKATRELGLDAKRGHDL